MTERSAGRTWLLRLAWLVPAAVAIVVVGVLLARVLRAQPEVAAFIAQYPGHTELPEWAPVGFAPWVGWQHFLNALFLLLIARTGWQMRTAARRRARPEGYWTRRNSGLIRTKNPPTRMTLGLWLHLSLDALWIVNGTVFLVLLFATGQWIRLVPTSWDVVPQTISVAIQYASLDWPVENGWLNYNALQLITYFVTVFIATPLALLSGLRLSPAWPRRSGWVGRVLTLDRAVKVHLAVLAWFVGFTIVHVTLVFATGALRNLNHMYAMRDDESWWGAGIFAVSVVVMVAAWIGVRPLFLRPVASLMGTVSR